MFGLPINGPICMTDCKEVDDFLMPVRHRAEATENNGQDTSRGV